MIVCFSFSPFGVGSVCVCGVVLCACVCGVCGFVFVVCVCMFVCVMCVCVCVWCFVVCCGVDAIFSIFTHTLTQAFLRVGMEWLIFGVGASRPSTLPVSARHPGCDAWLHAAHLGYTTLALPPTDLRICAFAIVPTPTHIYYTHTHFAGRGSGKSDPCDQASIRSPCGDVWRR